MEGLLANYDSDSDSEGSAAEAVVVDTFGDSEEEEEAAAPAARPAAAPSGLPSAASLLSAGATTSSWLKKPEWATRPKEFVEPAKAPVPAPARLAPSATPGDGEVERGDDMYMHYDPARGWSGKQRSNIEDTGLAGYKGHGGVRPDPPTRHPDAGPPRGAAAAGGAARKRDRPDRANAKERVKQQRLNGQSGIGENFKVWRSEEEMRLRQQFDS